MVQKMASVDVISKVTDDKCVECVDKADKSTTTQVTDENCAACNFGEEKKWCWKAQGFTSCLKGNTVCDKKGGETVPPVTTKAGCPKVNKTTTEPYLWCPDASGDKCVTSCSGTSVAKADKAAKCKKEVNNPVEKPYKFCTTTKTCGHDNATHAFACDGRVASAEANQCLKEYDLLTRVATMATKDTCGKDTTYNNGVWTKKSCDWIKGKIPKIPKADTCPATLKTLGAGCCKSSAPPAPPQDNKNKNGTKASSGSMVHPSVGAGIGAGIMALVAGLV
jgi:hypothetical protein